MNFGTNEMTHPFPGQVAWATGTADSSKSSTRKRSHPFDEHGRPTGRRRTELSPTSTDPIGAFHSQVSIAGTSQDQNPQHAEMPTSELRSEIHEPPQDAQRALYPENRAKSHWPKRKSEFQGSLEKFRKAGSTISNHGFMQLLSRLCDEQERQDLGVLISHPVREFTLTLPGLPEQTDRVRVWRWVDRGEVIDLRCAPGQHAPAKRSMLTEMTLSANRTATSLGWKVHYDVPSLADGPAPADTPQGQSPQVVLLDSGTAKSRWLNSQAVRSEFAWHLEELRQVTQKEGPLPKETSAEWSANMGVFTLGEWQGPQWTGGQMLERLVILCDEEKKKGKDRAIEGTDRVKEFDVKLHKDMQPVRVWCAVSGIPQVRLAPTESAQRSKLLRQMRVSENISSGVKNRFE
jgi:hypothetical protein